MSSLYWHPLHSAIAGRAQAGDNLFWIVSPFVKLDALERLFASTTPAAGLTLVCRWRPDDLVSGVSDLEVYPFLRDRGCQLFVNSQVHMKLYVYESNFAVSTSANLTLRGLGYLAEDQSNIEVGSDVQLTAQDWFNLCRIVGGSRLVTEEIYSRFKDFLVSNPAPPKISAPDLLGPAKAFTLASLPATTSPEELEEFYFSPTTHPHSSEAARRAFQDLVTFRVPLSLSEAAFRSALTDGFRESLFIKRFADHLRNERSLRFGAVNAWLQQTCEDVPLPYRWEIKSSTHALYNWLAHFYPEVTWDRPNYSQVIYWNAA